MFTLQADTWVLGNATYLCTGTVPTSRIYKNYVRNPGMGNVRTCRR